MSSALRWKRFLLSLAALALATPAVATTVDLRTASSGGIDGALLFTYTMSGAGSGATIDFLRFNGGGSDQTVQGYNSDARPVEYNETNTAEFNRSLRLSDVPLVEFDGTLYRQFGFDINEPGNAGSEASQISIDDLEIYLADSGDLTGHADGFGGNAELIYDFDADDVVLLSDFFAGSGQLDMVLYIPEELFATADGSDPFVYLYSLLGGTDLFRQGGGPEAWSAHEGGFPGAPGAVVPLPSAVWLMFTALIGTGLVGRIRRRRPVAASRSLR